jgi:molecular chaperone HscA
MALLNISEPGQSPRRKQDSKHALGIDLGTTNSLVASASEGGPFIISDSKESALLPSVVAYSNDENILVGQAALKSNEHISSVKRLMGRGAGDIKHELSYTLVESESSGMPLIETPVGLKSPVEVSAEILKVLAARGAKHFEKEVGNEEEQKEIEGVVITVPAYFDEAQRQATKDAARIADLNVLRLLSEPTAAAVAYGLDKKLEGNVIIFDLGGGTFDVSLMHLEKGVFEVLATGGDTALGGDDFDRTIMQWIKTESKIEIKQNHLAELSTCARNAKHDLSETDAVEVNFADWSGELDIGKYYQFIDPLIDRTIKACRRVLRDASMSIEDITDVVMVGGSTRSPRVQEKVQDFFKQPLLNELDPDQVVALGAAIQADILVGNKYDSDLLLLDVNPLSLGIETMGSLVEKIIPRNTTIPVSRAQEFTTFKDGQTVMSLHVLQGERELVEDCRSLAKFELRGIPPMVAGAAVIRVSFQVDADGLLSVEAEEQSSGVKSSIVVKPSFGLEEKEIESMIRASHSEAEHDRDLRRLKENEVEALRIIEATDSALAQDAELLDADELKAIQEGLISLQESLKSADADLIQQQSEALNELSVTFAARRMDSQIKSAFKGKKLEEVDR